MSEAVDYSKARSLFRAFHDREPTRGELEALLVPRPVPLLLVGATFAISYTVRGGDKPFFHQFKTRRPPLYVTADGRTALIPRGGWSFTGRGFMPP